MLQGFLIKFLIIFNVTGVPDKVPEKFHVTGVPDKVPDNFSCYRGS